MTDTNAPPISADLTVLLDRLAAVAPDWCQKLHVDQDAYAIRDDESVVGTQFLIIASASIFGKHTAQFLKDRFKAHRLPLRIEYPLQWDIVSVQSGEFHAQHSEEAIALLSVLVPCLEAMEGQAE